MDKTTAIVEYLIQCPLIKDNPLFFNFSEANDNDKQLITIANDRRTDKQYIDGSVMKQFTFTIIDYRSIAYQAIVKEVGFDNENIEEYLDVQGIIDWVTEQDELGNYPDFGSNCQIDTIRALTDNPNLNGVDTSVKPSIAKYSVSIQIDYLDTSKMIWK